MQTLDTSLVEKLNEKGAIAIPALLWFMGVPLFVVLLLWLFVFRG